MIRLVLQSACIAALCSLCVAAEPLVAEDGWTTDHAAAGTAAQADKKDILLLFTGSDWCPPCRLMKKNVFDSGAFKSAAPKKFVLVSLDFPRDKSKQKAEEIAQNRELQNHYVIADFPSVLLTDAAGRPYGLFAGYGETPAEEFVKWLGARLKAREARDAAFISAGAAQGIERAKHLDAALTGIDQELMSSYRDQVGEIIKLDADGKAGLRVKYQSVLLLPQIKEKLEEITVEVGDVPTALKLIDELEARLKPTGVALLEVNYSRAIVHYRANDKEAALKYFEAALAAAPNSLRAEKIQKMIGKLKGK